MSMIIAGLVMGAIITLVGVVIRITDRKKTRFITVDKPDRFEIRNGEVRLVDPTHGVGKVNPNWYTPKGNYGHM